MDPQIYTRKSNVRDGLGIVVSLEKRMPFIPNAIKLVGKSLPNVISPAGHAIADYGTAALFLIGAALFWKRSKRAAIACLICGTAETAVAGLTDYRGGIKHAISFPLHGKIDFGLASMAATMPEFLAFEEEKEKGFFRMQSAIIASVAAMTDFKPQRLRGVRERKAA
jgi:hypothetical protein